MSNFICPTCGFNNIDCGRDGYKTDREIELEKKLEIAKEALLDIENNRFSYIDEQNCVNTKYATQKELRIIAKEALEKIKE